MKPAFVFSLVLLGSVMNSTVRGGSHDDCVYLRRVGGAWDGQPRFELLEDRPLYRSADVVQARACEIEGLESLRAGTCRGGMTYVVRTSPSILPARYQVVTLPPGVGYMQSVGLGGGSAFVRKTTTSAPSPRPFGWAPYNNPLERPAYR